MRGELPSWARLSPRREAHIRRVAELLDEWAAGLGLEPAERARWRAAAWLHDALRETPAEELRPLVPEALRDLPAPLLHGPAVAERLVDDPLADAELLDAIRFHTLGHPRLGRLGRALYLADFLEPGRDFEEEWRASLRARMPEAEDAVLREVVAARIQHLLERGHPIRPETAAFWSALVQARGGPPLHDA